MTNDQVQTAYEHAVNELGLLDAHIEVEMVPHDELPYLTHGIVTQHVVHDDPSWAYYVIKLKTPQPGLPQYSLVATLGHELYHIWEFENNVAACESLCDAYGRKLCVAMGTAVIIVASAELRCCVCGKTMTEFEAEESEHGAEFIDELLCDVCFRVQ